MKYVYLLFLLFVLSFCKDVEKENVTALVKEWMGKEIAFPAHSIFTVQGKDTVNFILSSPNYKIVTYIDSVGCSSCKLKLASWKEFIYKVDSLTGEATPFLFYFYPKNRKDLQFEIKREDFSYPVCFDENDEFNRLNKFPSNIAFQTFLLDKNNKVVAVGNPIHNPNVKELYLRILTGVKDQPISSSFTELQVDQTKINFGSFSVTEMQKRKFRLKNTGSKPLVIQEIITSCGCTKVEFRKEPLRPGEELELVVSYQAEKLEHFSKTISVYCNVRNSPVNLTIVGNVR